MSSFGRFQPRDTRFLGLKTVNGWRLKMYTIIVDRPVPTEAERAVDELLDAELPWVSPHGEAVGFLITHRGAEAMWVLIALWTGDILNHHTFSSPLDSPTQFKRVPPGGPTACVWELAVHAHEREAFIRHVLDPPGGPDLAGYLSDVLISPPETNKLLVERFNAAWEDGDVDALMGNDGRRAPLSGIDWSRAGDRVSGARRGGRGL